MTRFSHIDRRSVMTAFVLAVVAVFAILAIIGQTLLGLFLVLAAGMMAALLYRSMSLITVAAPTSSTPNRTQTWNYDPHEPVVLTSVVALDGELHTARVVPLEQNAGHRLLLTAEGYLLADADGRVIHRFDPNGK